MKNKAPAPIVRTDMIAPFISKLKFLGLEYGDLLAEVGIDEDVVSQSQFIPVAAWYRFVELSANRAADRYFGYRVGAESAKSELPNLRDICDGELSLGDIINRLITDAKRQSNLGRYTFTNNGDVATLRLRRRIVPEDKPAQIDAFGFGFFIKIMKSAVGTEYVPNLLSVTLSEPTAIPAPSRSGIRMTAGDNRGPTYAFPADWLMNGNSISKTNMEIVTKELRTSIREIISNRLGDTDLSEQKIAQISGRSLRSLQWGLMKAGTTYRKELDMIRQERATDLLSNSDVSISDVAHKIGYRDTTGFIRAFKNWTGITPGKFRKNAQ